LRIICKNRINVLFSSSELLLDPKKMDPQASSIFVSHAHTDHLPTSKKKPVTPPIAVCSEATARLFYERIGYELDQQNSWRNEDYSLSAVPGGHTFDSTVAEIKDLSTNQLIVYTGDINIEDRGYLKGYQPKKCDVLILEATWGDKHYRFPPFKEIMEQARSYIQGELDKGYPVAVLGYPLGKSQLLNHCLGDLSEYRFSSK